MLSLMKKCTRMFSGKRCASTISDNVRMIGFGGSFAFRCVDPRLFSPRIKWHIDLKHAAGAESKEKFQQFLSKVEVDQPNPTFQSYMPEDTSPQCRHLGLHTMRFIIYCAYQRWGESNLDIQQFKHNVRGDVSTEMSIIGLDAKVIELEVTKWDGKVPQ